MSDIFPKPNFMKSTKFLYLCASFVILATTGCKKENSGSQDSEIETTFQLSENQAVSEAMADDVNIIFYETAAGAGLIGSRVSNQGNSSSCASVSINPQNSFPKTIVIDFGTGCTSADGITRKGKINIVLSDSVHIPGSNAVMTFENYHVENFKIEGTITWINTTSTNGFSWSREIDNGKVTAPGGNYYWLHEGIKYVSQTAGASTPLNLLDDVYSVTGNHIVTNPHGRTRSATITEPLEKKVICHNVSKGKIKIEGPNHFAILDYGDGTCDRIATISIDGNPPRTILLP